MKLVQFEINSKGNGHFFIMNEAKQIAEMVIGILDKELTVYHTQVLPEAEGKGLASQLLKAMVDYARENKLKVIALCPYVFAQFKRHPDEYEDIWKNK